jgi:hypothetical protein
MGRSAIIVLVLLSSAACKEEEMPKQVPRDDAWLAARTTPDGDAKNARLLASLEAIRGSLTQQAADAFYDALIDSALLLVTSAGAAGDSSSQGAAVSSKASSTPALSTRGPDGQEWLMAFTDKAHVAQRFPQGASVICLPATAIAVMAETRSGMAGIVLNPGPNNAGGQPIARKGVIALARGLRPDQLSSTP